MERKGGNLKFIERRIIGTFFKSTKVEVSTMAPVIFIHGMFCDSSIFDGWLESANNCGIRGYSVDLPGHGKSGVGSKKFGKTGIIDYVNVLISLVDYIGPCSLVGHSMGALIARMVENKSDLIKSVISVTSTHESGIIPFGSVFATMLKPSYMIPIIKGRSYHSNPADVVRIMGNELDGDEREILLNQLNPESGKATLDIILQPKVKRLRCPSLVIGGGMDRMTPSFVQRQIAKKHGSRYRELYNGCHMVPIQSGVSREAFREIREFIPKN